MFTAHDSDTSTDEMATEATEAQSESESTDMFIGTKVSARFVGYGSQPWLGKVVSRETDGKGLIEWIDGGEKRRGGEQERRAEKKSRKEEAQHLLK